MEALVQLSRHSEPDDFIIATGKSISLLSFAEAVFNWFGLKFDNHAEYDPSLLRAGDPSEVHYDPGKATNMLKWGAALRGTNVPRKLAESFQESSCSND